MGGAVPLSEYEQRVLEELEQQLRSDDPKLANTISGRPVRRPLHVGLGIVGLLGGLAALVGGSATGQLWLSVAGFLLMFSGVLLAISRPRTGRQRDKDADQTTDGPDNVRPIHGKSGRSAGKSNGGSSFMDKLEERWDRRRREP